MSNWDIREHAATVTVVGAGYVGLTAAACLATCPSRSRLVVVDGGRALASFGQDPAARVRLAGQGWDLDQVVGSVEAVGVGAVPAVTAPDDADTGFGSGAPFEQADNAPPTFMEQHGRWLKEYAPSVGVIELQRSWLPDASVIYIGKASLGASGRRGLRSRLREYPWSSALPASRRQ